jgi:hypothetical protein
MAAVDDGVDPDAREEDGDAEPAQTVEDSPEVPKKPPRGHIGAIYQDVFKDLFPASPSQEAEPQDADPDAGDADAAAPEASDEAENTAEATMRAPRPWEEIDLTGEDAEIEALHQQLEADHIRVNEASAYLKEKWEHAARLDEEHGEENLKRPLGWEQEKGLVVGTDIPIPDSKLSGGPSQLKNLLHHGKMQQENLAIPRHMMHDVERHIAHKTGVLPEHDNLLAVSKPDAPNYLKDTGSNINRMTTRNIQPRLTEAQRTMMESDIAERNRQRPPMPKVLNAEERMKNLAIVKKM